MGWNDHIYDTPLENEIEKCSKCNKIFKCSEEPQTPGCRDKEYKICPFCKSILDSSMSVDYYCSVLSDTEIEYLLKKGAVVDKGDCM